MKRFVSITFVIVVAVMALLVSLSGASSAAISPIATPTVESRDRSPVATRAVPYVNQYGETIVRERVIVDSHGVPAIMQYKATPQSPIRQKSAPQQQSVVSSTPMPYAVYLPIIYESPSANVMAIVYEGESQDYNPETIMVSLTNWINLGTTWHGITTTQSAIAFGFVDNMIHIVPTYPPTQTGSGWYDLNAVYQQFDICNRIAAGEIDEVWIMADGKPYGHVYSGSEWTVNAETWALPKGMPTPYCGRQIYTLLLNFDAQPKNALESWVHSMEGAMKLYESSGYEACDFTPLQTYGLTGGEPECTGAHAYNNLYAYTTRPDPVNGNVGMCGDAHIGANVPSSIMDYDPNTPPYWFYVWDYPNTALNRCNDWQWGNVTSSQTISCAVWGCNQTGWQVYYLQNMPGLNNNSHGRSGALRPNWWNFRMPTPQ
jgi:hypothetical protein